MFRRSRTSKVDSWLRGILRSLIGVVVGVLLIIAMVGLLLWNEVQVLQTERAVELGGATVSIAKMAGDGVAASPTNIVVWTIRPVGLALLVAGFALVGGPLSAFANIVPGMGAMVRFGTGIFASMFGLGAGTATIALVWLFYRPWLSVLIVLAGAAIVLGIGFIGIRIANTRYRSEASPPLQSLEKL